MHALLFVDVHIVKLETLAMFLTAKDVVLFPKRYEYGFNLADFFASNWQIKNCCFHYNADLTLLSIGYCRLT